MRDSMKDHALERYEVQAQEHQHCADSVLSGQVDHAMILRARRADRRPDAQAEAEVFDLVQCAAEQVERAKRLERDLLTFLRIASRGAVDTSLRAAVVRQLVMNGTAREDGQYGY